MKTFDPSLNDTIDTASQLHRSALRLLRMLRALPSDKGFSIAKMGLLTHLYQEGTSTATGLANYLRIRPQSVTRLLADLDKQGYIKRKPDKVDRRQSLIEITPSGTELLIKEGRGQQEKLAQIMGMALSKEEMQILQVSSLLMDRLISTAEKEFEQVKNRNR